LFPVLAVLLSTVGVLCLLLLVVSRQALFNDTRRQRIREARRAVSEARAAVRAEVQRREDLAGQVAALRKQLAALQAELAHIVERTASEREQTASLRGRLRETQRRTAQLRSRLSHLQNTEQQRAAKIDEPGWVVTLVASPHGDDRVPLFFECRRDRVTLQPAGIDLFETDFAMGPAGRSAFQIFTHTLVRMLERRGIARPYPVLIVRPAGIAPFYASMHQLEAAGLRFGYELVEAEKHLQFPELDRVTPGELRELLAVARLQARQPPGSPASSSPHGLPEVPLIAAKAGSSSTAPLRSGSHTLPRNKHSRTEKPPSNARPRKYGTRPKNVPANRPRKPGTHGAAAPAPAPSPLVLTPPHGGVWYRPVHALLTGHSISVLPHVGTYGAENLDDHRLNELLRSLASLTAVESRLVVLEVRPRLICMITPDAVLDYWRLKWHLARAGVEMEAVLITDDDAQTLRRSLAYLKPLTTGTQKLSAPHTAPGYSTGGRR